MQKSNIKKNERDRLSSAVDRALTAIYTPLKNSLNHSMPSTLSKRSESQPIEEDVLAELPFPACLLNANKNLLAFNIKFTERISEKGLSIDDLYKTSSNWDQTLNQDYQFKFKVPKSHTKYEQFIALYLSAPQFAELLHKQFQIEKLTTGEASTLIRFSKGEDLRSIAKQDNTTYETRRTQLKTIKRKLNVSTSAQLVSHVVNTISIELTSKLYEALSKTQAGRNLRSDLELIIQHYGNSVRLLETHQNNCPNFLVLDLGPKTGTPVLTFHSVFYPCFPLPFAVKELYKHNLRMLVPVRPGYCGVTDIPVTDKCDRRPWLEAIETFVQENELETIKLLGLLRGSIWAAEFLEFTKHKIDHALFASPYIPGSHISDKTAHGNMASGLRDLVTSSPKGIRIFLRGVAHLLRTPDQLMNGVEKLYQNCPIDKEEFKIVERDQFQRTWLPNVGRLNITGIANDIICSQIPWQQDCKNNQTTPITFITGEKDPLIPNKATIDAAKSFNNSQVIILKNTAFLYYLTKPELILSHI